jgi:hypothetical protein
VGLRGENLFTITALPSLGDLGMAPPLTLAEFMEWVAPEHPAREIVDLLLLEHDLMQREALASGEIDQAEPVVLTPLQMDGTEPLPEFLQGAQDTSRRVAADAVWAAYYRHAAERADALHSTFLKEFVGFEVALRNQLAEARAKELALDVTPYLVAPELAPFHVDLRSTIGEWSSAAHPLDGLKVLDRARWNWIEDHDAWFTFSDDELAAYATKLTLLIRWERLSEAEDDLLDEAIL